MLENIKKKNKQTGNLGEDIAARYLEENGCHVLTRGFSCNFGEVDIIFQDHDEIVFAEIKTRTSLEYGFPADSVTHKKQKHILNTAKYFLYINRIYHYNARFDVIEILLKSNQKPILNHIKNVFW